MNKIPAPTLSTDGWVYDSIHIGDRLMSDFFLSEFSQTALYPNEVASLPYIIELNKESPDRVAGAIQNRLTTYFSRYFTNVTVETNYKLDAENSIKASVFIFIEYTDTDGKTHSFAKGAELINGKFDRIVEVNNILGE